MPGNSGSSGGSGIGNSGSLPGSASGKAAAVVGGGATVASGAKIAKDVSAGNEPVVSEAVNAASSSGGSALGPLASVPIGAWLVLGVVVLVFAIAVND